MCFLGEKNNIIHLICLEKGLGVIAKAQQYNNKKESYPRAKFIHIHLSYSVNIHSLFSVATCQNAAQ